MKKQQLPLIAIYDHAGRFEYAARMKLTVMRRIVSGLEGAAFEVHDGLIETDPPCRKATLEHTSICVPENVISIAEYLLPEEERTGRMDRLSYNQPIGITGPPCTAEPPRQST